MDGRKRRKLFALCVLGTLFFMMTSLVPSFAPVVPVDASSATITITKVTPTELQPGDTKELAVTMKKTERGMRRILHCRFRVLRPYHS